MHNKKCATLLVLFYCLNLNTIQLYSCNKASKKSSLNACYIVIANFILTKKLLPDSYMV